MGIAWSVFLSPDSETSGGRRGFPSVGPATSRISGHSGFSETSFASAGKTVPAGVTPGVRGGSAEVGRVALDGSKVKANASKHKAMSYGRMEESEKRLRRK